MKFRVFSKFVGKLLESFQDDWRVFLIVSACSGMIFVIEKGIEKVTKVELFSIFHAVRMVLSSVVAALHDSDTAWRV